MWNKMVHLRMLCEKYITIDDELKQLSKEIDTSENRHEKEKLTAEYLQKYIEREDFKSGMRRHLINELVRGVK